MAENLEVFGGTDALQTQATRVAGLSTDFSGNAQAHSEHVQTEMSGKPWGGDQFGKAIEASLANGTSEEALTRLRKVGLDGEALYDKMSRAANALDATDVAIGFDLNRTDIDGEASDKAGHVVYRT
jgi:hypothetical protein